ncbi:hypothetical protein [Poseidonocella sp. HB161398]|uniref:hypothetical protein n=1 Tax=Poseidonocella sp. HB161398 TaxID=2320855 RepID=UPI00110A081D|nr:hypothetical protein [Poseidonocella sp. HB161398]
MTQLAPASLPRETSLLAGYIAREKAFRGIGPRRAAALAVAFGDGLGDAILALDERVVEIVGEEPAIAAAAALEVRQVEAELLDWLHRIGAGMPLAVAIRLALRRRHSPGGRDRGRRPPPRHCGDGSCADRRRLPWARLHPAGRKHRPARG